MSDKPVSAIAYAPVVSTDSNSPEAILARNNAKIQAQSVADSHFDTVLERFCGQQTTLLGSLTLILSLFFISSLFQKNKIRL